ncbi:MAG: HIRAN domain-containing protein, partial [Thermoguttaceae bacterium]|nr:HIRAN domain-containing protein [Thermoguttaceae bacterium]
RIARTNRSIQEWNNILMGELTINNASDLVATTANRGIDEILKPLVNEIHLFDSFIAGTSFLQDKSVLDEIKVGDKLTLRREDNKFDSKAILVLTADGKKLGYIPEKDNLIFSRLMDAGKRLSATISEIRERGKSFRQIAIGIYLVDF